MLYIPSLKRTQCDQKAPSPPQASPWNPKVLVLLNTIMGNSMFGVSILEDLIVNCGMVLGLMASRLDVFIVGH